QTLRPHHRVDVFLISEAAQETRAAVEGKPSEQATLFMQDMVILATGREFADPERDVAQRSKMQRPGEVQGASERDKSFSTVTLLVTPQEAAKLVLGQRMGSYRVALRGQG